MRERRSQLQFALNEKNPGISTMRVVARASQYERYTTEIAISVPLTHQGSIFPFRGLDRSLVDEGVFASLLRLDESKALPVRKPLDHSSNLGHGLSFVLRSFAPRRSSDNHPAQSFGRLACLLLDCDHRNNERSLGSDRRR